jgi:peptidoglycan/LPS O-acetylase OafA/YrhL
VTRRGSIPQLPAIDGLRAVAVVMVIFYHLGWASVPGGFLGVEVFFVVSGYLITSLLVAELGDHGYLDLGGFWARRLRRLLPALLLLLGFLAVAAPVLAPDGVSRLRSDMPASLLYLANWWQIFGERSYFEATAAPDLLRHLWSLAIEEQFYLLWPPIVAAMYTRLWRRRWLLPVISASGAALSVLAMFLLFDPDRDPSRVYYGTDTRASALLIGATLAFVWNPDVSKRHVNPPPVLADLMGGMAIVVLALAVTRYNDFDPDVYQGGFLLVSIATIALIVAGSTGRTVTARLLSTATLRAIGERSYGLYLWHWPIIQLTRPGTDVSIDGAQLTALRIGLIVLAAEVSWRLVERPLRRPRVSARGTAARRYRRAELVLAIALPLLFVPYIVRGQSSSGVEVVMPPTTQGAGDGTGSSVPGASVPTTTAAVEGTDGQTVVPVSSTSVLTDPTATTVPGATAGPTTTAPLGPDGIGAPDGADVVVVGDSVMVGAAPTLVARMPAIDIDAAVGRQLRDVSDILAGVRAANRLRPIVVLGLGNNGSATADQLERMMGELSDVPRIIIVTANAPRAWRDTVNDRFVDLASRHPNIRVVDWNAIVSAESGLVGDDGIHLTAPGAARLADVLAAAITAP